MESPMNWIKAGNAEIEENIDKYDLSDEQLAEFLKSRKKLTPIVTFYKYDINEHPGLIPTINVNVIANQSKSAFEFKSKMINNIKYLKEVFPDFEVIKQPQEIIISGVRGIYFIGKYSMKTQEGLPIFIKSRIYAIPYKSYFFQINFIDGQVDEDCTEEFNRLVNTIKIGNGK